ncbi:MAG: type I DNA topoisomerase [Fretibacterium sp.]|nr:type I DNA topoisomerase [Fretibacterium sp.]
MQGAAQTKEVKKTTKAKPAKSAKTTKPADSTKSAKMAAATVAKPTGKTAKKTTGKTTGKTTKTAKTAKTTKKSTGRASAKKTASSAGKTLVIVESPSKARTLSGILGKDYVVASSVGHLRDLPRSRMAIDIENNFTPEYILVKGKAKIKNELLSLASTADQVLLASDPDREGEAIAWHLAELLDLDLSQKCRVRFYEITPDAVREAVKAPELVDLRKVNAQQARRILDRLVGYTLSPLLWNKIRYGLSAGRVQSVALSLICEREHEIARFIPEEYWNVTVKARTEDGRSYEMKVDRLDDKRLWKGALPLLIKDQDMAEMLAEEVRNNPIRVTDFRLRSSSRKPQPPFRTSTLQQEAARRLSLSPRRAMRIAQELYEGLNLPGRGHVGLITYMRTDSLRLSEEALSACRSHITSHYGEKYLPPSPNRYAAPGRSQDAHEAIRPTDVTLTPASLKDVLNAEQYRLYDLIWRRFTASQMANAVVANSTLLAEAGRAGMRQLGESLIFEGWSALWPLDLKGTLMEEAKPGEPLLFVSVDKEQKFTRPPSRYSEATLIKTLEEKGVGRPSTYATIVETLYSRGYVERNEERRLSPTGLGMTVDEFLKTHFDRDDISSIVDTNFTAQMEKELDEIEEDKRQWLDVVSDFWDGFSDTVEEARTAERVPLPEPEPIGEDCPECGKPLVKKRGRFGEFIACTGYPDCRYTRAILTKLGVDCPKCSEGDVVKRRSRKGRTFYGCSRYPDCDYVSWNPPTGEKCPDCQTHLVKKGRTVLCPECGYKVQEETVSDV